MLADKFCGCLCAFGIGSLKNESVAKVADGDFGGGRVFEGSPERGLHLRQNGRGPDRLAKNIHVAIGFRDEALASSWPTKIRLFLSKSSILPSKRLRMCW